MASHVVPYDVLVELAHFGGESLAVPLGLCCRGMKALLCARWRSPRCVDVHPGNVDVEVVKAGGGDVESKSLVVSKESVAGLRLLIGKCVRYRVWDARVLSYGGSFSDPCFAGMEELTIARVWIDIRVVFPRGLKRLTLDCQNHMSVFADLVLPEGLESLSLLNSTLAGSLSSLVLPKSLKRLTIDGVQDEDDFAGLVLPPCLEEFNTSDLPKYVSLPPSLKRLSCPEVDVALPESLEELTLKSDVPFDHVVFPPRLRVMRFSEYHGYPMPASLVSVWSSLEELRGFTGHSVPLPSSLKKLTISARVEQLEKMSLPEGLLELKFGSSFKSSVAGLVLPSSLKVLEFGHRFNQSVQSLRLPLGLETLAFGDDFNQSLDGVELPPSLRSLSLGLAFDHPAPRLPSSLRVLRIANYSKRDWCQLQLPEGLEELLVGDGSVSGLRLPSSLKKLEFGYSFNDSVSDLELPSSLQSLIFGWRFNQPLSGLRLPCHLCLLRLGEYFNQSVADLKLPSELVELRFGGGFRHNLPPASLPSSLRVLAFDSDDADSAAELSSLRAEGVVSKRLLILSHNRAV